MQRPDPPLPTFLIIGAQKSATRWLRVNLGEHPDIYTAPEEIAFFNKRPRVHRWGLDGYRAKFVGWDGEPVVGEATPGYMMWRHDPNVVSRRIKRDLPDVRLIAILRNPIDRAQSALRHHVRRGRLPSKTKLVKVVKKKRNRKIEQLGLISGGMYAASLRPYVKRFGDQLLVLLHDDLVRNPRAVYADALRHVGAVPTFVPDGLEAIVFSNRRPDDAVGDLTLEERCEMWEYFSDDVRQLQRLIGRNLGMWNPNRQLAASTATPASPTVTDRETS
jgi:hypothetical protein